MKEAQTAGGDSSEKQTDKVYNLNPSPIIIFFVV